MNRNEFLAFSLPHKLKVYVKYNHKPDNSELETMIGIADDCIITDMHEEDMAPLSISNYGLCLHPLSDLAKEIEHKGETFIPIVELARMAWKEPLINKFKINNGTLWYNFDGDEYYFEFRPNKGFLFARMTPYESFMPIDNQLGLFQKLIEWHFDLFDGIKNNEAIDVNTLEENPYK